MEEDVYAQPIPITAAHRGALARMYADQDMREYLVNVMRGANHNAMAMLEAGKVEEARGYSGRFRVVKDLLEKGKEHFINIEKINRMKEPLHEKEVEGK
jgi:hypothetical protein